MHDTTNGDTTALLDLPDPEFRSGSDGGGFRLFVIELNRDGMSTSRTELAIAITDRDPALRFAEIQRSSRERHAAIRDRGLRIRADLTPPVTWPTRSGAAQARRLLATALARDGFAVTGFDRTWRVYVIELSDEVGSRTDDR